MASKGLAKRLFSNWPAKVLSLAVALFIFFFYKLNRLEDRYISVPLSVSMSDEYVPSSQLPRSVRATLRGESNALFAIQEDDVRASLDLSGFRSEGSFRAPVQVERKGSALGVDPLEIRTEPAEVAVTMEKRVSRVLPVTPSFKGFLEPGFELVSFEMSPSEVEVSGPASAVRRLTEIQTDFIELAGRDTDFIVKARLVKKDSMIALSGDTVEFKAVVQRSLAVKSFDGLPIAGEGLADGLVLASSLPAGSIRVRSATSDVTGFAPPHGTLYVDLSGVHKPGSYSLKVQARSPEGLTIERFDPSAVQVVVAAEEAQR